VRRCLGRPTAPTIRMCPPFNNLAGLMVAGNRLGEAKPTMRRVVEIFAKFTRDTGHQHPHLQAASRNYAGLLQEMGRRPDQIRTMLNEIANRYGTSLPLVKPHRRAVETVGDPHDSPLCGTGALRLRSATPGGGPARAFLESNLYPTSNL
jgi:hypothetical protein